MDKKEILLIFINHFTEFIDDVIHVFPENKAIILLKDFLLISNRVHKTLLIGVWKKYVSDPYRNEISIGNFDFFVEKNWDNDLRNTLHKDYVLEKLNEVREYVRNMGENNKQKALQYVGNLSKICDLYYSS